MSTTDSITLDLFNALNASYEEYGSKTQISGSSPDTDSF